MRLATPLRLLPLLACLAAAAAATPPAHPPLPFGVEASGDSLILGDPIPLPAWRDFAVGPAGDLLLLTDDGDLLLLAADSTRFAPFSGDIDPSVWPEALAADDHDWLLLAGQGREVHRLGRRGEALGSVRIRGEGGPWRDIAVDRSGRIWLSEAEGGEMLLISRGGQTLQRWRFEDRLPGFRGPLRAWCPDGRGGLFAVAGDPARLYRVNGAGNPVRMEQRLDVERVAALAVTPGGELRLLDAWQGRNPGIAYSRRGRGPILLGARSLWRTRIAEPPR